ncbi:MAG: hypothetical protein GY750_04735 [Lentisphaerae bacterium]|nr:hypothetical protein [Lentisphaerota bacterium]MCP4100718.1 hypothetical protein [Lentisphaerota bacterium]
MTKKKIFTLLIGLTMIFSMLADSSTKKSTAPFPKTSKQQTKCPVMGGKINKNLYYDYKGQRIYVCCKGCIAIIKKNPEKYLEKLKKDGVIVEKIKKDKK